MPDALYFTDDPEACELLARDPFALLVGFAIDQQVPVQKAFAGPLVIKQRVGTLEPAKLAAIDLEPAFREKPAIHRFPGAMAGRVRELAAVVAEDYDGDASRIWREAADTADLKKRIGALPGFGAMKVTALGSVLALRFDVARRSRSSRRHRASAAWTRRRRCSTTRPRSAHARRSSAPPNSTHNDVTSGFSGCASRRWGGIVAGMKARTAALGIVLSLAAVYRLRLRRPILTWGATDEEAGGAVAGRRAARGRRRRLDPRDRDRRAGGSGLAVARADGPVAARRRLHLRLDREPARPDMHSVDRVLPEFQHPEVGDTIGFGANRMRLERVEPEHVLAWRSEDGNWVWTFVLDERDGRTRLISRNRFRLPTLDRADRDAADGARARSSWSARCCAGSSAGRRRWRRKPRPKERRDPADELRHRGGAKDRRDDRHRLGHGSVRRRAVPDGNGRRARARPPRSCNERDRQRPGRHGQDRARPSRTSSPTTTRASS